MFYAWNITKNAALKVEYLFKSILLKLLQLSTVKLKPVLIL